MRWYLFAVIAFVTVILQTTFFTEGSLDINISQQSVLPDILLILGMFVALSCRPFEAAISGWFLGFAMDIYSSAGRLGLAAIIFAVCLSGLAHIRGEIVKTRIVTQFIVALAVTFAVHLIRYMALYGMGESVMGFWMAVRISFFDGVYTAVLAPYIFWLLHKVRGPLRLPVGA